MSGDKKAVGGGGGGPDLELKRAFGELQHKMVETQQRMKVSDLQIENLKRTITHSQLTAQEIGSLPDQTPVYESVGRMFLLSNKDDIDKMLDRKQDTCKEKIKNLESNKKYLEKSIKESENSLRELIVAKKGATSS